MIALIGPTKLDFDLPEPKPTVIEIALLLNPHATDGGFSTNSPSQDGEQHMSRFECELVSHKLSELYEAGKVEMRTEGRWVVYEVTPDVCLTLVFLLLRHSSPHRRQTY